MNAAERIQAAIDERIEAATADLEAALDRLPTIEELLLELAARLVRAEAAVSFGYVRRRMPARDPRPPKPPPAPASR